MRVLLAPDKFKGSLAASEVVRAIRDGLLEARPNLRIDECPISDGGEGFAETMATALDGKWIDCPAVDALGRDISSRYLLAATDDGPTAVIEMSETAGMWRIEAEARDPMHATTRGVGMQIAHAIKHHQVSRITIGLGGSATNDGGCGMAHALGARFLDVRGELLQPVPAALGRLEVVDLQDLPDLPAITVACDVENPLLGSNGATAIFAGQKGADDPMKAKLESALARLVDRAGATLTARMPGAGAAGGLGFGLMHFCGARLVPGFDLVADLIDLPERVRNCDLVITGEGNLDAQSLSGKGPVGLARLAGYHQKPVVAFCGQAADEVRQSKLFTGIHALADSGLELAELIANAAPMLRAVAGAVAKNLGK